MLAPVLVLVLTLVLALGPRSSPHAAPVAEAAPWNLFGGGGGGGGGGEGTSEDASNSSSNSSDTTVSTEANPVCPFHVDANTDLDEILAHNREFELHQDAAACVCSRYTDRPRAVNQTQRLLRPLYMHVPKCGSTFATTLLLAHCPWLNLKEVMLSEHTHKVKDHRCFNQFTRFSGGHDGGPPTPKMAQLGVTLLRNPEDRLISGFLHNFHGCPRIRIEHRLSVHHTTDLSFWEDKVTNEDLVREYAECTQAMSTLMLNGLTREHYPFRKPSHQESVLALQRIMSFAFVGIHEEWDKTVCLYRAMFGGEHMSALPFKEARASVHTPEIKEAMRKTLKAIGWRDVDEWMIYNEAKRRFNKDVAKYLGTPLQE